MIMDGSSMDGDESIDITGEGQVNGIFLDL